MEFKDKLKDLREKRNISQQKLADEIFVSRSAIAKWESGLGLPGKENKEALIKYFEVSEDYFEVKEPDSIILEKNKSIQKLEIISTTVCLFLMLLSIVLTLLIINGNYGFTSKMAAGNMADNKCIHTKEYDFYYGGALSGEAECIEYFRPVKKCLVGYRVSNADYKYQKVYYEDGRYFGIIYTIKGKDCYYNIFESDKYGSISFDELEFVEEDGVLSTTLPLKVPMELLIFDKVNVDGKEYQVKVNSFFKTKNKIKSFTIKDYTFIIK